MFDLDVADPCSHGKRGLRAPEAAGYVGVSPATWRRLVAAGKAPKPVQIGRIPIWLRDTIDSWLSDLAGVPHEPAESWQMDLEQWVP
jgi:predicted DNA-binding transcriptional regulator AlpA